MDFLGITLPSIYCRHVTFVMSKVSCALAAMGKRNTKRTADRRAFMTEPPYPISGLTAPCIFIKSGISLATGLPMRLRELMKSWSRDRDDGATRKRPADKTVIRNRVGRT